MQPGSKLQSHSGDASLAAANTSGGDLDKVIGDSLNRPGQALSRETETATSIRLLEALTRLFHGVQDPDCRRLLGPSQPGASLPGGARVPGTPFELEPARAAFNIMTLMQWSADPAGRARVALEGDQELAAVLSIADYRSRQAVAEGGHGLSLGAVLATLDLLAGAVDQEPDPETDLGEDLKKRRAAVWSRFQTEAIRALSARQCDSLRELWSDPPRLANTAVDDFVALLVAN